MGADPAAAAVAAVAVEQEGGAGGALGAQCCAAATASGGRANGEEDAALSHVGCVAAWVAGWWSTAAGCRPSSSSGRNGLLTREGDGTAAAAAA